MVCSVRTLAIRMLSIAYQTIVELAVELLAKLRAEKRFRRSVSSLIARRPFGGIVTVIVDSLDSLTQTS